MKITYNIEISWKEAIHELYPNLRIGQKMVLEALPDCSLRIMYHFLRETKAFFNSLQALSRKRNMLDHTTQYFETFNENIIHLQNMSNFLGKCNNDVFFKLQRPLNCGQIICRLLTMSYLSEYYKAYLMVVLHK